MTGVSVDHSGARPVFGGKSFRGYGSNMDKKNTILIDIDSDYYDNVIIIDVPDSVTNKFSVRDKGKGQVFTNVINIDDEDDDDMCDDKESGDGVKNKASTSRNFSRAGDGGTEDGKRVQTPVRLSKCKRTYSGKGFGGNHYGLDTDSEEEGDASDSDDFPDCEVMVDSSGRVQREWEKAFFKRWKDVNKGVGNNCSTSKGIGENQGQRVETEDTRRTKQSPFSSDTNKSETGNRYEAPSSGMNVDTEVDARTKSDLRDKESPFVQTKLNEQKDKEPESSNKNMDAGPKNTASLNPTHQDKSAAEEVRHMDAGPKNTASLDPNHQDKSAAEEVRRTSTAFAGTTTSAFNVTTPGLKIVSPLKAATAPIFKATAATVSTGTTSKATTTPASTATGTNPVTAFIRKCQRAVESVAVSGSSDPKNFPKGTTRTNKKKNSLNKPAELRQDDKLQSSEKEGSKVEHRQKEYEGRVIIEREKLKETDEYKKAMDEEMASRQKAVQVQAEEAQRQKQQIQKRKKAESKRLSEVKKRQKTRLEEMRTTQKKDEENMNIREVIRAEVRKDLQKLELACKNMASLLHSLGVSVTSWPNPTPQEVQAAYKKALLTFHPDRASRSDIRKQVEAEEKFKLVNRLKEKFSL